MLMLIPASARCWSNVLGRAAPLSVNEALWFAPATGHAELAPHGRPPTLDEVNPIRIGREGQLERVASVIAVPVTVDQSLQCSLDFNALSAANKGVR